MLDHVHACASSISSDVNTLACFLSWCSSTSRSEVAVPVVGKAKPLGRGNESMPERRTRFFETGVQYELENNFYAKRIHSTPD